MKAVDFNLAADLRFDVQSGITSFKNNRLVLFDANAFGLLRQMLLTHMGTEQARTFLLRFGFQNGYADFLQMKIAYDFDSEMDLLASGPVIHTWEGIVQATPTGITYNREKGEIHFAGVWRNSYEAEQHLSFNHAGSESVCWPLAGYAAGWTSAFMGRPVIAIEPHCVAKGDEHCGWLIQPPDAFGPEADPHRAAFADFFQKI
jgi:hypothetical protein